jgi:hypothetical protein
MKLRVTVEVLAEETGNAIAQGTITGNLDITRGSGTHSTDPILTVRMGNILEAARQVIFDDSNDLDNA